MPKIIENLKVDILITAGEMIEDEGINGFSIRSLSQRLGIAPATVYNYFESKEQIIGEIVMGRWSNLIIKLDENINKGGKIISLLEMISEGLKDVMRPIFVNWLVGEDNGLAKNNLEHIRKMRGVVFLELCTRVETILKNNGMAQDKAEINAPLITKLLVLGSHDHDFNFAKLISALNEVNNLQAKGDILN